MVAETELFVPVAAPVVIADEGGEEVEGDDGVPPTPLLLTFEALLNVTGSFTNRTLSNGTATRCAPTPRTPPSLITTDLMLPLLSVKSR